MTTAVRDIAKATAATGGKSPGDDLSSLSSLSLAATVFVTVLLLTLVKMYGLS